MSFLLPLLLLSANPNICATSIPGWESQAQTVVSHNSSYQEALLESLPAECEGVSVTLYTTEEAIQVWCTGVGARVVGRKVFGEVICVPHMPY